MKIGTAGIVLLSLFNSSFCQASLGGRETSIESDRGSLAGRSEIVARHGYSVHEITVDGNEVREYALPDGTVFAVSWQGVAQPDLSVILGRYFGEYLRASSRTAVRRRGGALVLRARDVIIEKSGHMRDVRGKAYLPGLMPGGFEPGDIG